MRYRFDVGATDLYRRGLLVEQATQSGGRDLDLVSTRYSDCPVAEVNGALLPVRYVCAVGTETVVKEGRPAAEWLRLEETFAYDGYGNRLREVNRGVVAVDGEAWQQPLPAPRPGQHTREVCGELGLTEAEVAFLLAAGAIA